MAAAASKSGAHSCQNDQNSIQRCSATFPLHKLTQDDLDALNKAFLDGQVGTDLVDRMSRDVFEKMYPENSFDEMFKASVCVI